MEGERALGDDVVYGPSEAWEGGFAFRSGEGEVIQELRRMRTWFAGGET